MKECVRALPVYGGWADWEGLMVGEPLFLFAFAGSENSCTMGRSARTEVRRQVVQGGQLAGEDQLVEFPAK